MKEYRKKLDAIGTATHEAIMAYHDLKKEYEKMEEKLKKYGEQSKTDNSDKILTGTSNLIGRKIKSIEATSSYYDHGYLYIICEDGQRVILSGRKSDNMRVPKVDINKMKEMIFYNDDEVQQAIDRKEYERQQRINSARREKERELERLKAELGNENV